MKDVLIGTWAWGPGMNGTKMVFGNKQDPQALKESFDEAVKLGFLNWDTAAVYGMGSCEKVLGGLIAGHPEVFISTKFMPSKKYKAGALVKSFEESMARLGRSYADLFWIHVPNNLEKNIAEAVPLMKDGRIKSLGVSNVSLAHIKLAQELLAKDGLTLGAVQNHFSIIRNDQQPIIDYCNENGIKYYAYMVLEQGALAGHYSYENPFPAFSLRSFLFPRKNFKKIEGLLASMRDVASKYNIDPSQVPILWVMAKGANPIVGVTKPSHVKKLAAAIDVTLAPDEVDMLTEQAANSGLRQQGSWEPQ